MSSVGPWGGREGQDALEQEPWRSEVAVISRKNLNMMKTLILPCTRSC